MRTIGKNVDRGQRIQTMNLDTDEHENISKPLMCFQKLLLLYYWCCAHSAILTDQTICVPSSGRTSIDSFVVVVAWRRGDAKINFADTADNCRHKVWTDADCKKMQTNLGENVDKQQTCGNEKPLT